MRDPFDGAVAQHGPAVLRVCRAVLGAGPDADDAWSETFMSALRAWPKLPDETNIEAWLVRVAHRRAVDVVRKRVRTASPISDTELLAVMESRGSSGPSGSGLSGPGLGGLGPGGFRSHDDDEPGDQSIWDAVATLPPKQRLCVAYRYLGGLAYAEVAELVGGSESAARRSTADGVAALRKIIVEPAGPDKHRDFRDRRDTGDTGDHGDYGEKCEQGEQGEQS